MKEHSGEEVPGDVAWRKMQKLPAPQPLTLSNVSKLDGELWSSDSDSGITAGSRSPPSKSTPDSATDSDFPPPWSRLAPAQTAGDDKPPLTIPVETRDVTALPDPKGALSAEEDERQQSHLRATLLEYQRHKRLSEELAQVYYFTQLSERLQDSCQANGSDAWCPPGPNRDQTHRGPPQSHHGVRPPERLSLHRLYSPDGSLDTPLALPDEQSSLITDDGYGTDGRSFTTASLSSVLSSSLSSLTTDSSSSASQRGCAAGSPGTSGSMAVRQQPVLSSGRLPCKRGILVKRRDLPPVERMDSVTLEDRLRALTTIEEEETGSAAAPKSSCQNPLSTCSPVSLRGRALDLGASGRCCDTHQQCGDDGACQNDRLLNENEISVAHGKEACVCENHISGVGGFHKAVPVVLSADGSVSRWPAGEGVVVDSASTHGFNKLGRGGGVRVNQAGELEIDYSYYMKASPSESNDEINTFAGAFYKAAGHALTSSSRDKNACNARDDPRPDFHQPRDSNSSPVPRGFSGSSTVASIGGCSNEVTHQPLSGPIKDVKDFRLSLLQDQMYLKARPKALGLRQDSAVCSMPNLSSQGVGTSDVDSGVSVYFPNRVQNMEDSSIAVQRRSYSSSREAVYTSGGRRPGAGDRNSCDVGSLYRQAKWSASTPHVGTRAPTDRLSLNLGDLPRIHEQLRATSEMLISQSPRRHQFASSSDIYKLFQGQQTSFSLLAQGKGPLHHRHSCATFPPWNLSQTLADVDSRVPTNSSGTFVHTQSTSQGRAAGLSGLSVHGPIRGNHNIALPEQAVYSRVSSGFKDSQGVYQNVPSVKDRSFIKISNKVNGLRETLEKGQRFATDVIEDENGERLSTLV